MITVELVHPLQQKVVQSWQFPSDCTQISIGRSRQNDITLMSAVVSRQHAVLKRDPQGWRLEAVGANGCFVDDKLTTGMYMRDGAIVRIAKTGPRLRFALGSASEPEPQPDRPRSPLRKEDILSARDTWLGNND